jgi:hypothetical protein
MKNAASNRAAHVQREKAYSRYVPKSIIMKPNVSGVLHDFADGDCGAPPNRFARSFRASKWVRGKHTPNKSICG